MESSYKDEVLNWAFEMCVKENWKYVHLEYAFKFTTIIFTYAPDSYSIGDALKDYSYPPQGVGIDEDDLNYKYHQYFFINYNGDGTIKRVYWDGKPTEGLLHNVWCGCWKNHWCKLR